MRVAKPVSPLIMGAMTLILKNIFNLIRLLNSDTATGPIAWGVVCGMILGFSPVLSLQSLLVFLVIFFTRVQLGAALILAAAFGVLAYFLDPVFDVIGSQVLEIGALEGLYTALYNMPIVPFTRFNNSVVMGAGVVGACLALPVFYGSKFLIHKYRATVVARFENSRIWKAWKATTLYKWYLTYQNLAG